MRNLFKVKARKAFALLMFFSIITSGFNNGQDENTVKAIFIYNFTKHIEWPKGKINGKFTIGVLGTTPVYDKLNVILKDRRIKELPVEIRKLSSGEQVEACDILFISRTENSRLKDISENYDYYGVLIVTEDREAIKKGSCINIIEKDNKFKFEIDDATAKRGGLKISKQLYDLAEAR